MYFFQNQNDRFDYIHCFSGWCRVFLRCNISDELVINDGKYFKFTYTY